MGATSHHHYHGHWTGRKRNCKLQATAKYCLSLISSHSKLVAAHRIMRRYTHIATKFQFTMYKVYLLHCNYVHVYFVCIQNKCSRYWPDATVNHSTTYEDLNVRLTRRLTASNKDYITTTFHLAHKQVSPSNFLI